jgi:hypothetical protein
MVTKRVLLEITNEYVRHKRGQIIESKEWQIVLNMFMYIKSKGPEKNKT